MARMEKIWMKRMNIPIWVAQLLVMLIFTGAAAVALYAVDQIDDDYGLRNDLYSLLKYARLSFIRRRCICADMGAALLRESNWGSPSSQSSSS